MRSVELFAGCGGLALGIAKAGFEHELIIERDVDSVRTLRDNKKLKPFRSAQIIEEDSRELAYSSHEGIDFVSGGPPCQPFSVGGKHLGAEDPRNMWPEAIRAIREIRPKAFLLENVRGLFRPAFSDYLNYIILQLSYPLFAPTANEGWITHFQRLRDHADRTRVRPLYRVVSKVVNTADYGAPQKRHRSIFMGILSEYGSDWHFPKPTHSQEALAWSKHVDGAYWERHEIRKVARPSSKSEECALKRVLEDGRQPRTKPWLTVRDAIGDLPAPSKSEHIAGHWQHPGARTYPNHTGSPPDEPAKALKAGDHGVPGGENMIVNRLGNVRYFTVREMARLQGFPDSFKVSGTWKAATRQLGNAVPTCLGRCLGKAIKQVIDAA